MTSLKSFFEWAIDNHDLSQKNPSKKYATNPLEQRMVPSQKKNLII